MCIAHRFMVMRTEAGLASFIVEKLAEIIEQSIRQRTVQFVLRKRADDERNAVICCTLSSKLDRLMRSLDEEGYTKGPQPSPEISMCEGQKIRIRFSGNVQEVNGRELKMTFHAQLPTRCTFRASEVDYFGQKALECYRGRVKIFSSKPASSQPSPPAGKSANTGSGKNAQHAVPVAHHDEEMCLCDLELSIPKVYLPIFHYILMYSSHFNGNCLLNVFFRNASFLSFIIIVPVKPINLLYFSFI